MTNDFKEEALKYMTGNITPEEQEPMYFRGEYSKENNWLAQLQEKGVEPNSYVKSISSDTTSNYLIYGTYTQNNKTFGFIVVMNENNEVEHIFTEYDSGTKLNNMDYINYDESGNIYGVDYTERSGVSTYPRFIMLNNVALKTENGYSCQLRRSYYFPEEYKNFKFHDEEKFYSNVPMRKVPNEPIYYFVGDNLVSNSRVEAIMELKINVGIPNEWNVYNSSFTMSVSRFTSMVLDRNGETNEVYTALPGNTELTFMKFDGETYTVQQTIDTEEFISGILMKDKEETYVVLRQEVEQAGDKMATYSIKNGNMTELYSHTEVSQLYAYEKLVYKNGLLFSQNEVYTSANENYTICGVYDGKNYVNGNFSYIFSPHKAPIIVKNNFDLYKFILQEENTVYQPTIVIYQDYSGTPYENYNSVASAHGELYDNGQIVFARSLYNKTILNNSTTSTIEVPFNYLNDVEITEQDLLSGTQTPMIQNTQTITKNQYENMFINFVNTLNVIDEDTSQGYPLASNYVNENLNVGTEDNYLGSKITKARVITDTINTQEITWTLNGNHYETTFTIYIDSTPQSIEFRSQDDSFIYLTKDISNLQVGNYYNITEKIRME